MDRLPGPPQQPLPMGRKLAVVGRKEGNSCLTAHRQVVSFESPTTVRHNLQK